MTGNELRRIYIDFFKEKGHAEISGKSLIPENDPTVLFTTAGMHPLVPYILGEPHPAGKRLVDCQKCMRTDDIDEVGDSAHLTFFEMLGNWSLGDYFKKDAIAFSYEFLTSPRWLGFSADSLSVTVFAGDGEVPPDHEAAENWKSIGIPEERIHFLPPQGQLVGTGGSDRTVRPGHGDVHRHAAVPACGPDCKPGCHCGKYIEVWNDVFMQYNKTADGKYLPLAQKTVDTGMGVERTLAMIQGKKTVFETELFWPIIEHLQEITGRTYGAEPAVDTSFRIIADHLRSSVFIIGDDRGVKPSNLGQGYILRRLIRRTIRHGRKLGLEGSFLGALAARCHCHL